MLTDINVRLRKLAFTRQTAK